MKAAELRQDILFAAFNGNLTHDWRQQNKIDGEWPKVDIQFILTKSRKPMSTGPFGTMIKKHEHKLSGVPVLGIENIGKGVFVSGNKIFVDQDVQNVLLPVPPLAEQQRIVAKVDELMALCDELKTARAFDHKKALDNIIPFPRQDSAEEELQLAAARGDATKGLSAKAQRDADELFGD